MRKLFVLVLIIISFAYMSCKSGQTDVDKQQDLSVCDKENAFKLHIENYTYQMQNEDFEFVTDSFIVKSSQYIVENDSMHTLKLMNYIPQKDQKQQKEGEIEIIIDLRSQYDVKIAEGVYKYNMHLDTLWSRVRINTEAGAVWFNRGPGMPKQGYVEIESIEDTDICGFFKLKVDNPEEGLVGKVELNGFFTNM